MFHCFSFFLKHTNSKQEAFEEAWGPKSWKSGFEEASVEDNGGALGREMYFTAAQWRTREDIGGALGAKPL